MTLRGIWKQKLKKIGPMRLERNANNLCALYMRESPTRPVVGFLKKYDNGFQVKTDLFEYPIRHKDRICIFYPNGDNLDYEVWEP